MIGWALRQAVLWSVLGLVFYGVLSHLDLRQQAPATPVIDATAAPAPAAAPPHGGSSNALTFRANPQGHVVIDAIVNGAQVRFLVDTGSTMVVLTAQDAARAGITANDLNFTMQTMTANGAARAAPVRLREVSIGQLTVNDVRAAVAENLGISLLGQSFLTRLDSYEMRDGVLTLYYW